MVGILNLVIGDPPTVHGLNVLPIIKTRFNNLTEISIIGARATWSRITATQDISGPQCQNISKTDFCMNYVSFTETFNVRNSLHT